MKQNKLELAIKVIAESMINNADQTKLKGFTGLFSSENIPYFETTVEINNTIVKLFIEAEFKRREN